MKYVFQIGIIAMISLLSELLNILLPLPVPASVYGLVILFFLLLLKIIKLEQVEDIANFFMAIMPLLFISPSVSLITSIDIIKGQIVPLVLMIVVSTVVVTAVTGWVAQIIIRLTGNGSDKNE